MAANAFSEIAPLRRVLLRHPRDAFGDAARIAATWRGLDYLGPPDLERAVAEYERLVALLSETAEVAFLPGGDGLGLDSVYVRDAAVVTPKGVVLANMGKDARRAEPAAAGAYLEAQGIPVLGTISGDGRLEGGDVVWFDAGTLAVAIGGRTNPEGVEQLMALLGPETTVVAVPLPDWRAPGDVFHLMSVISPLDHDLALVYPPLTPPPVLDGLRGRGLRLLDVPDEEFGTMGCNVLALAPRRAVMLTGNPRTQVLMEAAGVSVATFDGAEICAKGCGGPTCLTRPLVRG
jgi:N-dimethylarginine dimethylaminohydrolase